MKYKILFIFLVSLFCMNNYVYCEKEEDDIFKLIEEFSCQTKAIGTLLKEGFDNTCVTSSVFDEFISNVVSPGMYASAVSTLKIKDTDLFPDSCKRKNRLDGKDPRISFAFCNNNKAALFRAKLKARAIFLLGKSIFSKTDILSALKPYLNKNKKDFYDILYDQKEGNSSITTDIIPLPWKIIRDLDKLCVATYSFKGWIPVGCKYIKEPFAESIYGDFIEIDDNDSDNYNNYSNNYLSHDLKNATSICNKAGDCYKRAYKNSKSPIVITSPIIECTQEMITKLLISDKLCNFHDIEKNIYNLSSSSSSLIKFQNNMRSFVMILLSFYALFFGARLLFVYQSNMSSKDGLIFFIKIILVAYFAIGIDFTNNPADKQYSNGLTRIIIPLLLGMMEFLSSIIINPQESGLCSFDNKDYAEGFRHLALWDSIDCRMSHYLGLDLIKQKLVQNSSEFKDVQDNLSYPVPPYLYLLIPAILSGKISLILTVLSYPILVISVSSMLVGLTITSIISIAILTLLAPLFIPLYLFNMTKRYFSNWARLLVSFALQPMIMVVFIVTIYGIYEKGFYNDCRYTAITSDKYNEKIDGKKRKSKYFFIDEKWLKITDSDSDKEIKEKQNCRASVGYFVMHPINYFKDPKKSNDKLNEKTASDKTKSEIISDDMLEHHKFLKSVEKKNGKVMNYYSLGKKLKLLVAGLFLSIILLYLMNKLVEIILKFAADMTGGVPVDLPSQDLNSVAKGQTDSKGQNSDKNGGGERATDKISENNEAANDKISESSKGNDKDDNSSGGEDSASDKISENTNDK